MSFDASIKIHQSGFYTSTKTCKSGFGGIAGYIHHIDRGTDRKNGCEINHSNPDIRSDSTLENESYFRTSNGVWQQTDTSNDMLNAVNGRIEYAKQHGARITDKGKMIRSLCDRLSYSWIKTLSIHIMTHGFGM